MGNHQAHGQLSVLIGVSPPVWYSPGSVEKYHYHQSPFSPTGCQPAFQHWLFALPSEINAYMLYGSGLFLTYLMTCIFNCLGTLESLEKGFRNLPLYLYELGEANRKPLLGHFSKKFFQRRVWCQLWPTAFR